MLYMPGLSRGFATNIYRMRVRGFKGLLESARGHGWFEISAQHYSQRAPLSPPPSIESGMACSQLAYNEGGKPATPSGLVLEPMALPVRWVSRRSWVDPGAVDMVLGRLYPTGSVRAVVIVLGRLVDLGQSRGWHIPTNPIIRLKQFLRDNPVVEMPGVDPGSFDQVVSAAHEMGIGLSMIVSTRLMTYQFFSMDEDEYFWVASTPRGPRMNADERRRYHSRYYRADQVAGVESLVGHLIRSGADFVPWDLLGLSAGDRVEHDKFGAAEVLSASGGRCGMRFDNPVRTMSGGNLSIIGNREVQLSTRGVSLRVISSS